MPPIDDDSDLEDTPLDESDSDLEIIGDVTMPVPVTITDSTSSFLRDMGAGKPMKALKKPPAFCPECGREMHLCSACESGRVECLPPPAVNTGEP